MKIHSTKKIKAFIVDISEIKIITEFFTKEICDSFSGNPYKKLKEFKFIQKDGDNFNYDNIDSFIKSIELNIDNIEEIEMSFHGNDKSILLKMGKNIARFSLDGEKEGDLFELKNYLQKKFKTVSWNNILL